MKKHIALLLAGWIPALGASPAQAGPANYTALYVFGDSYEAASGADNRYWQGRFSNGPLWPELLSTNLGFSYVARNNRAAPGATTAQVLAQVRALAVPTNAASALFVVDVGKSDFSPYVNTPADDPVLSNLIRTAMLNLSNSVVQCYAKGARTLAIMNVMDVNWLPRHARRIANPALTRGATQSAINGVWTVTVDGLSTEYPDLKLVRVDLFAFFDALGGHPEHYGFTRIDLGALEDPDLSNKSCQGPGRDYLFWDDVHLTTKGHVLLAQLIRAAVKGSAVQITPESGGARLTLDPLQIGLSYRAQQSIDLVRWTDLASFAALDVTQYLPISTSASCGFYRLQSDGCGSGL
jgi:phospholipase/lecithinase/hemolysin